MVKHLVDVKKFLPSQSTCHPSLQPAEELHHVKSWLTKLQTTIRSAPSVFVVVIFYSVKL